VTTPKHFDFDLDEYGPAGIGGYGFSLEIAPPDPWEPGPPPLTHIVVTIMRPEWLQKQTRPLDFHQMTNLPRCYQVLTWLSHFPDPQNEAEVFLVMKPSAVTFEISAQNRPGFGYPGTEDWQWQCAIAERVNCPPLGERSRLTITQATPPNIEWDVMDIVPVVQEMARQYLFANPR
jgi:hypothetical protein